MQTHPKSSNVAVALKTGGALVLLCTGVAFLAGRLFFDIYELIDGQPIEKPASYAVGTMFLGLAHFTCHE